MSLWHSELIKANGHIKAYVEIQNDYTGTITAGIRNIFEKDNIKYFMAEGKKYDCTKEFNSLNQYNAKVTQALKFFNKYGGVE